MVASEAPLRAVDANVILRYLLGDVPEQAARATRLIDSGQPLGVTAVVLAEVAWTLTRPQQGFDRPTIANALLALLARENVVAVGFDADEARAALLTCTPETGGAGLGDALITACARSCGVTEMYSFDRQVGRAGLTRLEP